MGGRGGAHLTVARGASRAGNRGTQETGGKEKPELSQPASGKVFLAGFEEMRRGGYGGGNRIGGK